ncbi:unnamed protein product [Symbiodinium natans]|uniref:Uncharacterized protein n=1 Tax=Symbiodinium natans TaxID=878477 RepID=A0A812HSN0_9DINO|nr:unnamed protein product [Symbiodinium natans]
MKAKTTQARDRTPPKSRPPDGSAVEVVTWGKDASQAVKPGPDQLSTPKVINKGSRSLTPKRPQGPSTFGASKENETVAGWVEHDTRIRSTMPLNPAAEERGEKATLAVHPALEAAREKGKKPRGVKRYAGIGAQASSVDQVIFGRDMDFSGEGDGTDLAEYDGRAGLSSQSVPRAGGVKKVDAAPRGAWNNGSPVGSSCEEAAAKVRSPSDCRPLSPNRSPGVAKVFGQNSAFHAEEQHVQAAREAFFGKDSAGAPSWKSPKASKQEGSRTGVDLVGAVVFGQTGAALPETSSVADSRKRRVDVKVCFADTAGQKSAELHAHKGKRVGVQCKDTSGSAGCPSANLCTLQAGWHPEARDRLVRTASGFHEPHCAMKCTTDKVVYGQMTPRQSEPLWAERKANLLREYPGRKHLGALEMPFMSQQADIFCDGHRRTATPPPSSGSGFATPRGHSRSGASLFEGSAGKPTALAEWDQPRPTRALTPPPRQRVEADAFGKPTIHGVPTWARDKHSSVLEGGQRRLKGHAQMPLTERQHPIFGRSNVACLLGGE